MNGHTVILPDGRDIDVDGAPDSTTAAAAARKYLERGGRVDGGWQAFAQQKAEANPLFPEARQAAPAGGAPQGGAAPNGKTRSGVQWSIER